MEGLIFDGSVVGRMGRVLVVDDEAAVRKPIRLCLIREGYEVVEAEDGEQAIRAIREGDNALVVDTILCDLRMPKIDGVDAIHYFRQHYPCVPIVVLTGYPDVQLATSLFELGIKDYLLKPVTRENLMQVLRRSVEQHVILDNQFVA